MWGPGRLLLPDGTLIESEFEDGEPNNRTRIFKTNGDYFAGLLFPHSSKCVGAVQEKGIRYQGELLNRKPHGLGKEECDQYKFEGTF
jgi:hypothetical protein